jgi:hypothetical protein
VLYWWPQVFETRGTNNLCVLTLGPITINFPAFVTLVAAALPHFKHTNIIEAPVWPNTSAHLVRFAGFIHFLAIVLPVVHTACAMWWYVMELTPIDASTFLGFFEYVFGWLAKILF